MAGMDVLMPQLGETVTEGTIIKWFKAPGDRVGPGDTLFEIETDKTTMEVPAISPGVLGEIRVREGGVAAVGAVVAVIADDATGPNAVPVEQPRPAIASAGADCTVTSPPAATAPIAAASPAQTPPPLAPFQEVRTPARNYGPARLANGAAITPLARRLAAEAGIEPSGLTASGPGGRIMARDVGAAIAAQRIGAARAAALPASPTAEAEKIKAQYRPGSYREVSVDGLRRTIANRLVKAKQTIPHFYLTTDVDLDALIAVRNQANDNFAAGRSGEPTARLTINDVLIKALAAALQRVPAANAAWAGDRILYFDTSDIAVAVAIEGGLITPIIRDAQAKSVLAISAEMRELAARARERKLSPEAYQGGATTISNLGMHGVRAFSAIINPPQATTLAIGAAERRPVEAPNGGIIFATRMTVTLSCDHRLVDGALGAELLAAFKSFVEQPVTALV